MTRLDQLDPTRADDPAFDPDGQQAQRVFTAAQRKPQRAPRRRVALALATVATAAAATVVVTTTTSPTDARAALLQAAERTANIDSGRAAWTLEADRPEGYRASIRNEIRFSGDDSELVSRGTETLPDGRTLRSDLTIRRIDGIAYQREGDGAFTRIGPVSGDGLFAITGQVDNKALVALVKSADDLEVEGDTYRGTVTAGEVEDAAPTAPGRAKGPAWDRPVSLEITVDRDGYIRFILIKGRYEMRTTEYSDLGQKQVIERP